MPKVFTRLLTLRVEGEIYDTETKPEDIIKNYEWKFSHNSIDSNELSIIGQHQDRRGRITSMIMMPQITRDKKPDTEYFLI